MELMEATKLGFSRFEFEIANNIAYSCGYGRIPSAASLVEMLGIDYNAASRIKYLIEIITGRKEVNIDDVRDLSDVKAIAKHFRKINPACTRLSTEMLSPTRISSIPKIAVVKGIRDENFRDINSRTPNSINEYYTIEKQDSEKFTLRMHKEVDTNIRIDKDRIVTILGRDTKGNMIADIKKENVRVCNRFIIVASIRQPIYHHGMYVMITSGGDILYVYARTVEGNRNLSKNYSERVYNYGVMPCSMQSKLKSVAMEAYRGLKCVCVKYIEATQEFRLIMPNETVSSVLI